MSDNQVLKFILIGQILAIALIIFGFSTSYEFFRWNVLLMSLILFFLSYVRKQYHFAITTLGFAVLFNPIFTPVLSKTYWIIADVALMIFLVAWLHVNYNSYRKGLQFERFVLSKFDDSKWTIVDYTKDLIGKIQRFVESDTNPDFLLREKVSKKKIAIECKYRSLYWEHPYWGAGISWDKHQGGRYQAYANQNGVETYVVIGVGGNPSFPKDLFCIPIDIIQSKYWKFIPKDVLEQYTKIPPVIN